MRLSPLLALLLPAAAFAQSLPATSHPKLPFTLSQETTAITSPLRPDGTVDYLAALNQKYSQGVTPDNNGFVLFLQVTGTGDSVIAPKTKAKVLQLCGAKESAPASQVWESYVAFLKRTRGIEDPSPADEELAAMRRAPWRADQHPDLAAFLKANESLLTLATQAAQRPHWWTPKVASGSGLLISTLLPSLGTTRDIANALCARALLRANAGDIDGFLDDIHTVRQLARHLAGESTLIERLVGISLESLATATVAAAAAVGTFTEPQCKQISATLDALPPLPSVAESIDIYERWISLDIIQYFAVTDINGSIPIFIDSDLLSFLDGGAKGPLKTTGNIDRNAVDWDAVFKQLNAFYDANVAATRSPTMHQLRDSNADLDHRLNAVVHNFASGRLDLTQAPDESRAAYSTRIAGLILTIVTPTLSKSEVLCRRANQQTQMTRLLLTAAQFKARTGTWPKSLNDLVPAYLKDLPKDLYSPDESAPVRYLLTPSGPRIYSIGENARDDAGIRQPPDKDDLAIGAP